MLEEAAESPYTLILKGGRSGYHLHYNEKKHYVF